MYGSIMRGRIKTGRREEFERLMCELSLAHVADERGLHCVELAWEDEDSNRVVMILHFEDRQSYVRNTEHPQTQRNYGRWSPLLEGEAEWVDVAYADYVGHALTQTIAAPTS